MFKRPRHAEPPGDLETYGDADLFSLVSEQSSKTSGAMRSVKFMPVPGYGGVLQITSQERSAPHALWTCVESLVPLPGVYLAKWLDVESGDLVPYLCRDVRDTCFSGVPEGWTLKHLDRELYTVPDLVCSGNRALFVRLSSAFSELHGFAKTTSYMPIDGDGGGVLLVETRQRNADGTWTMAHDAVYLPESRLSAARPPTVVARRA